MKKIAQTHILGLAVGVLALFAAAVLSSSYAAAPPQDAGLTSPASVAKPSAFVSLDPVPRNSSFEAAVVIEIAQGFHMNSNKPSETYLIPTTLTLQTPSGFRLLNTNYPPGRLEKFSFSPDKPLNVYTGKAEIRLQLSAGATAPLGVAVIPAILRYQACNSTTCLPPVKIPVSIKLNVAPAGAKRQAAHPELFSK